MNGSDHKDQPNVNLIPWALQWPQIFVPYLKIFCSQNFFSYSNVISFSQLYLQIHGFWDSHILVHIRQELIHSLQFVHCCKNRQLPLLGPPRRRPLVSILWRVVVHEHWGFHHILAIIGLMRIIFAYFKWILKSVVKY